jgi:hypothetical protein
MSIFQKEFNCDTNGNQNEQPDETPKAIVPKISKVDLNKQTVFKKKLQKMVSSLGQYLDPHWGADVFFGKTFMAERLPPTHGEAKSVNSIYFTLDVDKRHGVHWAEFNLSWSYTSNKIAATCNKI